MRTWCITNLEGREVYVQADTIELLMEGGTALLRFTRKDVGEFFLTKDWRAVVLLELDGSSVGVSVRMPKTTL